MSPYSFKAGLFRVPPVRFLFFLLMFLFCFGASSRMQAATLSVNAGTGTDPGGGACHTPVDGGTYQTIQRAVNCASANDTVSVAAGVYGETVTVNKTLTINGAQAGADARTRSGAPATESTLNNADGGFDLAAENIIIDGFTIQGTTGGMLPAAISTSAMFSGYQIKNNIIRDNTVGINLNSDGFTQSVVEKNLIEDNNLPSFFGGTGIFFDEELSNAMLRDNRFAGDNYSGGLVLVGGFVRPGIKRATACAGSAAKSPPNRNRGILGIAFDVSIQNNEFIEGNYLVLIGVFDSNVTGNTFSGTPTPPSSEPIPAIFLLGDVVELVITGNTFTNRESAAIHAVSDVGINEELTITNNTISQNINLLLGGTDMIRLDGVCGIEDGTLVSENTITLSGTTNSTVPFVHGINVRGFETTTVNITKNTLNGGNVDAPNGITDSGGIRLRDTIEFPALINIRGNYITGFVNGVMADALPFGVEVHINVNRISGNSFRGVAAGKGNIIDAQNNFWGCNGGPGATGCDGVSGDIDETPFLVLKVSASPSAVNPGDSSTLTADLRFNSLNANTSGQGFVPNGTQVNFSSTGGTVSLLPSQLNNGIATATFTAGNNPGTWSFSATVDNAIVNAPIVVNGPTAASVTISGRIFAGKTGLRNAIVTMTDSSGTTRTVLSGMFGHYRFADVEVGQTYIFTVSAKNRTFSPQTVTVAEEMTELHFTAQE